MMQADEGAGVWVGRGWAHDVYSGGRRVHRIDSITPHRDVREGGEGYMAERGSLGLQPPPSWQ